ncbi:MAG: metallophosphoesterase, partial [Lentisphaeria bacterium]|nr:metallophosphoesterase [Lentisphaeria bacterium]
MKRLLLADVHAGLHAFEAVLADAPPVDEILFLGDIVGYGPHPAQCVDLLRTLDARCILGNHDEDVLQERRRSHPEGTPSPHALWLRWTLEQLDGEQLDFLESFPMER